MTNLSVKLAIGTLTAGALGGGAYGIYTYNNTTDTVKNYLTNNKFILTNQEDSNSWNKVFETYKLEKEGFEIDGTVSNGDAIKEWCKANLTKKIKSVSDSLFQKASKWCVSYQTIEEQWSDKFEGDVAQLTNKYSGLTDPIKGQVDKETVTSGSNSNGDKIKRWCDTNKKRRFSKDDQIYSANIEKICLKSLG